MHIPQLFPRLLGKTVTWILAALVSLRMGLGVYAWKTANALERPSYRKLCMLDGGVELREYLPYIIAETEMAAGRPMREATGAGFRQVASYLFGQNRPQQALPSGGGEKMTMTAPVRSSEDGKSARLSFVLPSKFSLRTAPRPLDKRVRLRQVQPHYLAARAFSGPPPGERRVQRERERVLRALSDRSLRPASGSETLVYGYHGPRYP